MTTFPASAPGPRRPRPALFRTLRADAVTPRWAEAQADGVPAATRGDMMSAATLARARPAVPALEALLRGPRARGEVEWVGGLERAWRCGEPEVQAAADEAVGRCGQALLAQRLDQARAKAQAPDPWRGPAGADLVEYAARPLEGETLPALVRSVAARQAVSAA